jgi:hypothetical protein
MYRYLKIKMDFKQLKKASSLGSLTEKLLQEAEKMGGGASMKDDRIFSVERDKAGLGFAVVRFMPAPPDEDHTFVKLYNHGFKVNGKWLIENCPTTIGDQCPICTSNTALYDTGIDANKKIGSQRKRKLSFYSNVYIVKNPSNPSLEGTVMLYRFGQKIFDKIKSAMKPEFEDDTAINPFDLWEGANFKIKVKTVKESSGQSYPNYDDSVFESPAPFLGGDDEELEKVWRQCYSLADLVSSDKFKSYDDLEKRLNIVLGTKATASSTQRQEEELEETFSSPSTDSKEDIMQELEKSYNKSKSDEGEDQDDDDFDDSLARFKELAN